MNTVIPASSRLQRGWSGDLWTGRSLEILMGSDPRLGVGDKDDFAPYVPTMYDLRLIGASSATVAARDKFGGEIRIDTAAVTVNLGGQIQRASVASGVSSGGLYAISSVRNGYFEVLARLSPSTGTSLGSINCFLGMCTVEEDALETDGTITATGTHNAAGFYIVGTDIRFVSKNGTSFTAQTAVGTVVADQAFKVGFQMQGLNAFIPFHNGTAKPNKKITTLASMPDGDYMVPTFAVAADGTIRPRLDLDNWGVAFEDQSDYVGAAA